MDARLDTIRSAPSILAAMHRSLALTAAVPATSWSASDTAALGSAIDDPGDQITAIAAIHALARLPDEAAGARLVECLVDQRPFVREHAVWALRSRPLTGLDPVLVGRVVGLIRDGGLTGMLAQLTIERLSRNPPGPEDWVRELVSLLDETQDVTLRARLIESVGLIRHEMAATVLRRSALDPAEAIDARVAALGALGERPDGDSWTVVRALSGVDGSVGDAARLTGLDLGMIARPAVRSEGGLTIGQLYLHAELDPELSTAGMGETGGIATLLVRLGDALVARPGIDAVTTISRGTADRVPDALAPSAGHAFAPVPLGAGVPAGIAHAWPGLVDARRGIRRILRAQGPMDRLHLRMADVGSLAGSMAARSEGIPTVFSLAPDPHALIAASERSGTLSRSDFGAVDAAAHLWFRVALVRRLVRQASKVVLFPRQDLRAQLHDLVGIDIGVDPGRFTVVPEGIDTSRTDLALTTRDPHWQDVEAVVSPLTAERRGLPLIVSVGRMHDVKGMARVVAAWAGDASLADRTNLVIVGGDMDDPSPDEAAELGRIQAVLEDHPAAATGLVLAGHRPNGTVSRLLVAARRGYRSLIGEGGAYVCGSRKEEFGLAIVEALAVGLPVVAPQVGGPVTYVADGDTGVLVDTTEPRKIADGIRRCLAAADDEARAKRARELVHGRFTIGAMAAAMAGVYARPKRAPDAGPRIGSTPSAAGSATSRVPLP